MRVFRLSLWVLFKLYLYGLSHRLGLYVDSDVSGNVIPKRGNEFVILMTQMIVEIQVSPWFDVYSLSSFG